MAIGLGLMLGVRFPDNFNMPYRATDLRDFWRRWHMTLSRLIRDYLYIPLGGSRQGWGTYVAATLITMGLCGLWHGAGWTFVAWGLMHGVGLIVCRAWHDKALRTAVGLRLGADHAVRAGRLGAVSLARLRHGCPHADCDGWRGRWFCDYPGDQT